MGLEKRDARWLDAVQECLQPQHQPKSTEQLNDRPNPRRLRDVWVATKAGKVRMCDGNNEHLGWRNHKSGQGSTDGSFVDKKLPVHCPVASLGKYHHRHWTNQQPSPLHIMITQAAFARPRHEYMSGSR